MTLEADQGGSVARVDRAVEKGRRLVSKLGHGQEKSGFDPALGRPRRQIPG